MSYLRRLAARARTNLAQPLLVSRGSALIAATLVSTLSLAAFAAAGTSLLRLADSNADRKIERQQDRVRTDEDIARIARRVFALENVTDREALAKFRKLLRACVTDGQCVAQLRAVSITASPTPTTPAAPQTGRSAPPVPPRARIRPRRPTSPGQPTPPRTVTPLIPLPKVPPGLSLPIPQLPEIPPVGPVNPKPLRDLLNRILEAVRP